MPRMKLSLLAFAGSVPLCISTPIRGKHIVSYPTLSREEFSPPLPRCAVPPPHRDVIQFLDPLPASAEVCLGPDGSVEWTGPANSNRRMEGLFDAEYTTTSEPVFSWGSDPVDADCELLVANAEEEPLHPLVFLSVSHSVGQGRIELAILDGEFQSPPAAPALPPRSDRTARQQD